MRLTSNHWTDKSWINSLSPYQAESVIADVAKDLIEDYSVG